MTDLQFVPLVDSLKHEVADVYARVFAGPPWFEVKKCSHCNETYGKGDDLERFQDSDPCRRCGQPLKLVDYWRGGPALEVFEDAVTRPRFVGIGAQDNLGQLVGFSWGFAVPETSTPSVWFAQVRELLVSKGIDPAKTFYAAETGVDPRYQSQGIGRQLSYTRIRRAHEIGFSGVCFRTINPKMVSVFLGFFGQDNVKKIFNDPDPVKSDREWYWCSFGQLKDLPDLVQM